MQIEKVIETEEIENIVENNYGIKINLEGFKIFSTKEDKIWIATKEAFEVGYKMNTNSMGMYFGKFKRGDKINLGLEAIQMFVKNPKRNVVTLDEENAKLFMRGSNIKIFEKINCEIDNFVLVKTGNNFLGVGILKEDKVENLLPRSRRIY